MGGKLCLVTVSGLQAFRSEATVGFLRETMCTQKSSSPRFESIRFNSSIFALPVALDILLAYF